ncbi:hypothetical protein FHR24_000264 [Wenyingzhuangia heitensis]|uniref:TIGR01777 family protein n=1 Tax=Wenyingzhuangia heitensis TaxID=1487859 RepID=A0ABX0U7U6_9FLAO|nr:TIGR01777 family oxidoreductase [Wenyingzhuangia heitensis]NIJ43825.1 hypothetical protein [Wenyingzhuangia heitensis]
MKVVITGGTGLVGQYLQRELLALGYQVVVLTRRNKTSTTKGLSYAVWDIDKKTIDTEVVCSANFIIHLAGANIADGRWTKKQKQIIIDSRVKSASLLFDTLQNNKHNVSTFISASGADCYGVKTTDQIFKESDSFGTDFLANVCEQWEGAANQFQDLGIRTVCLRTGIVFAKEDSALQKIEKPIRLGIGSPLGLGNQVMSFIHIKDLVAMYIQAIQNLKMEGAYNAVADNNTNSTVTKLIASVLKKPLFMPNVPSFVLKLLFGKMASILLEGSAVNNSKIKSIGFTFTYPDLATILKDVLTK